MNQPRASPTSQAVSARFAYAATSSMLARRVRLSAPVTSNQHLLRA